MFQQNPLHNCDSYKLGHMAQYPAGTTLVYSNFTPRSVMHSKVPEAFQKDRIVWFGLQGLLQEMKDLWDANFFQQPKEKVMEKFARRIAPFVGPSGFDMSKVEALHDLGYLPIRVKALPEGSLVDVKIPMMTVVNTLPEFYWITNFLETWISAEMWKGVTSATTAFAYRQILELWAERTGAPMEFVDWQAHDFSMRGMSGVHDAAKSGAGHLVSFLGTDSLPAVDWLEGYYAGATTFVGGSVPATEHSVMCMGGKEDEIETFRRLIEDVYPSGIVSIVSDTWDFWQVVTTYASALKDKILSRQPDSMGFAKVVFRPDSGDPVDILCGTTRAIPALNHTEVCRAFEQKFGPETSKWEGKAITVFHNGGYVRVIDRGVDTPEFSYVTGIEATPEERGAVQCLWDIFGGTETEKGFKVLNQRVGLIYGDSITPDRANQIMARLYEKGFASCNTVLGVGSFTYQYATRDTLGFAMKATYGEVNGEGREIFKDPKTDSGTKKSARGLLRVEKDNFGYVLHDRQSWEQEGRGELRTVFEDGKPKNLLTLWQIRENLKKDAARLL